MHDKGFVALLESHAQNAWFSFYVVSEFSDSTGRTETKCTVLLMWQCFISQPHLCDIAVFIASCALPAVWIPAFNFTISICSTGRALCKDKGSGEEVARSSKPKQEVTGNTETLVQTVCLLVRSLKKTNTFTRFAAPSSINRQRRVWIEGRLSEQSEPAQGVSGWSSLLMVFFKSIYSCWTSVIATFLTQYLRIWWAFLCDFWTIIWILMLLSALLNLRSAGSVNDRTLADVWYVSRSSNILSF